MNLFLFVEGEMTEKKVYTAWLPMLFDSLKQAVSVEELQGNHFFITAAKKNPCSPGDLAGILETVCTHGAIDMLFLCFDAEEATVDSRRQELEKMVQDTQTDGLPPYAIIIQNRTIETWFLGNRRIVSRAPQNEQLRRCLAHYSVVDRDPEALPVPDGFSGTHARYHEQYLKAIFDEHGLAYRKSDPGEVLKVGYLDQLIARVRETPHLATFNHFLKICQTLGWNAPPRQAF